MIVERRCSVCGRLLSLGTTTDTGAQYCPDRPCILYPSVAASRAEDPTVSAWALAVYTTTDARRDKIAEAMGRAQQWVGFTARKQRKRWDANST